MLPSSESLLGSFPLDERSAEPVALPSRHATPLPYDDLSLKHDRAGRPAKASSAENPTRVRAVHALWNARHPTASAKKNPG